MSTRRKDSSAPRAGNLPRDSGRTETWSPSDGHRQGATPRKGRLRVGHAIAHYVILEELGIGGMGVVYKARDTRLGRHAALKFLPSELAQDPLRLDQFRRKARTASALNHPHICTVHDIGEHDGQPYLVMEMIEGRTLRPLVEERPSPREFVQLAGQVARALAAAHAAEIVHRDIKPENIMVRADGYAKLVDFGLALLVSPTMPGDGSDDMSSEPGDTDRDDPVHVARTGPRGNGGESQRHLLAGHLPVRAGDRPSSLQGEHADRRPACDPIRGPAAPAAAQPGDPRGTRSADLKMLDKDPLRRPAAQEVADELLAGVSMTEGELVAMLLAERVLQQYQGTPYAPDLARAFAKITTGLSDLVTVDLRHLEGLHSFRTTAPAPFEPEVFRDLLAAATHRRRVVMDYWTASRDEQTRRRVRPLPPGLRRWPLVRRGLLPPPAGGPDFLPGRIRSLELTEESFVVPAGFDIGEYLRLSFGIMHGREGELHHVRLRFRGDAVRYVRERTWHASQALETTPEGDLIVSLEVSHLREVERWALSWTPDCEVLEPPELREHVAHALALGAGRHTISG